MKNLIILLFLLFFSSVSSQTDSNHELKSNLAIVSATKMNVVYRGIKNPISIVVPNAKSFTASAPGLSKSAEGKYYLSPGVGLFSDIELNIELTDGSIIKEKHSFRIKGIEKPMATINEKSCCEKCILEMTKEELYNASIGLTIPNFDIDIENPKSKITGFTIKLQKKELRYEGNVFNSKINSIVKKLKNGAII